MHINNDLNVALQLLTSWLATGLLHGSSTALTPVSLDVVAWLLKCTPTTHCAAPERQIGFSSWPRLATSIMLARALAGLARTHWRQSSNTGGELPWRPTKWQVYTAGCATYVFASGVHTAAREAMHVPDNSDFQDTTVHISNGFMVGIAFGIAYGWTWPITIPMVAAKYIADK